MASTLLKFTPGAKLTDAKDFKFNGFINKIEIIKSRSNSSGATINTIFRPETGFNNVLSDFQFLTDNKLISGSGMGGYYIDALPDHKYRKAAFEEGYNTDEVFRKTFDEYMSRVLVQVVPGGKLDESTAHSDAKTDDDSEE